MAAKVRVRAIRANKAVPNRPDPLPLPVTEAAVDAVRDWLRTLEGGDLIRVDWLDGSGTALTGSGTRGAWTVPIEAGNVSAPSPAPAPGNVATAPAAGPIPGWPEADAGAPLERAAAQVERTAGGSDMAALAGGLAAAGASIRAMQDTNRQTFALVDRLLKANEDLARGALEQSRALGAAAITSSAQAVQGIGTATAQAQARTAEALGTVAGRMADSAAANLTHAAELNGEMIGRASEAIEARIAAEGRALAAEARLESEQPSEPAAPAGDTKGTIEALSGLVRAGGEIVHSTGKEAAKRAIVAVVDELGGDGDVPAELVAALKKMTPEARARAMGKLAVHLA